LASSGGVGNFCFSGGPIRAHGAVFEDIWDALHEVNAIGPDNGWPVRRNEAVGRENHAFDEAILCLVLLALALRSGVDVLLCTDVVGADTQQDAVKAAVVHNASLTQHISAGVFVDGTGDGILARHAGATMLPVDDASHPEMLKPSLMLFLGRAKEPRRERTVDSPGLPEAEIDYSVWPMADGRAALKLKMFEHFFDTGDGRGVSEAEIAHRLQALKVVRHYQKHAVPQAFLEYMAPVLGIREGRRVEGDYVLTGEDIRSGRRFDDAVAYGSFTIDTHRIDEPVPPYQIPLRSLFARGLVNVLIVGRCFSADRLALASARVMPTCCLMGQAAGIAAALACRNRCPLRGVAPTSVRRELIRTAQDRGTLCLRLERRE
jgi:hypothetical protein